MKIEESIGLFSLLIINILYLLIPSIYQWFGSNNKHTQNIEHKEVSYN
jgi:hypothetical protein